MAEFNDAVQVDIVSDVVCPWCAIGYYQLAAAAREVQTELDVRWHPFELNRFMPQEGENLREHLAAKYGTTPEGSEKARARLTAIGADIGFTFNYAEDMRVWNTFNAHQLIDWAGEQGRAHETKLALFEAFFTHRLNISDIGVLTGVARGLGMNADAARNMLESQARAEQVRTHEDTWLERGVHGVPAMVFNNRYMVTGAQGTEAYAKLLMQLKTEEAA